MSADHVQLRFATAADLPAIFEIYHHEVLHGIATFDTVPRTPEQQRDWLANHPEADCPAIVAMGTTSAEGLEAGRVGARSAAGPRLRAGPTAPLTTARPR